MTITKRNEGRILTENIFIEDTEEDAKLGVYSWYGGEHIEITNGNNTLSFGKKDFLKFAEMIATLKDELEKYDK